MKWLWNNNVALVRWGAGFVALGFVCAFFAFLGFGSLFHAMSFSGFAVGAFSILCGAIFFCLKFGVRSDPKRVIGLSVFVQGLMAISLFLLHDMVDFYARLYSPLIGLALGGVWFVTIDMAALLLLIGLIRLFFYKHRQS
jgi:hypothetical protein